MDTNLPRLSECPLATIALFAFNERRHIRAAVSSVLAQTYRPLEVILSDDCSDDGTYAIIEEMAAGYRGHASIILNRNERNLGIIGHANRVMSRARGELIVLAAGDDVSMPQRTEALMNAWLKGGRIADGLHSAYWRNEGHSRYLVRERVPSSLDGVVRDATLPLLGATAAWTSRLWRRWNCMPTEGMAEDQILSFWALLGGGIGYVDEPLVEYRANERSASAPPWLASSLWRWRRSLKFYQCYLDVLNGASGIDARELSTRLRNRMEVLGRDCELLSQGRMGVAGFLLRMALGRSWLRLPISMRLRRTIDGVREIPRWSQGNQLDPNNPRALRPKREIAAGQD